ncbi:MAG: hypothetical protein QOI29_2662, partial [Mycobacterium sp.]|nr:hypothetical protein [Mycobacterium sp.]
DEALPAITGAARTPLTLSEGLHWLLQRPETLQRGHCFMTIGSRRRKPAGSLDARTPAVWISNGTGRDGAAGRDAPKVGWCWPATGTRGSGSPPRQAGSPSTRDVQPHLTPRNDGDAARHRSRWFTAELTT